MVLSNGQRLKYRLNGHLAFWVSLLLMGHGCPKFDPNTGKVMLYRDSISGVLTCNCSLTLHDVRPFCSVDFSLYVCFDNQECFSYQC